MIQSLEDGRKEDGNRSIADKILGRLRELKQTVKNNYGRWAWELLQNAKDSVADFDDRKVSVEIELSERYVEFRHNGGYFTQKDIRGLINQISSKEVDEDEEPPPEEHKKTGKFGTGFITSHLLSRVVQVGGILKADDGDFYKFRFPLDREGKTTKELAPKIEETWQVFHNSYEIINDYDHSKYNTSFRYEFANEPEQKNIAKKGIEEFKKLIPFVLVFNPKIHAINIISEGNQQVYYEREPDVEEGIASIKKRIGDDVESLLILCKNSGDTSVATQLTKVEGGYAVKDISSFPKLFCDFPLIGTEKFHFPMVVNSSFFNPLTERDGVWLGDGTDELVQENRRILQDAAQLYKELIGRVSKESFFDLYNMAQTKTPEVEDKYFDARWYKAKIQQPLRSIIFQASLVEPAAGGDKRVPENLGFPDSAYKQEDQLTLWSFIYDMYPSVVCKKAHIHQWLKVSWRDWKRITPKEIANKIANKKGLTGLAKVLGKDRTETIEWLNSFYAFIVENNEESVFTKIAVIPNQKGDFRTSRELFIDAIDDSTLVKILRLLGDDWEEVLIEQAVFIEDLREKTKQDIANEITEQLKEIKNVRTSLAVEQKASIMILSDWFDHNDENLSTKLFQFWYSRKHELFVSTIEEKEKEIISELIRDGNLEQVSALAKKLKENPDISLEDLQNDELSSILDKHGLKSVEELDAVLAQAKDSEIFEQMKAILQNENYRDIFGHISNPKYFPYAQKKLARVRERVREHLTGLDGYNLDSAQYMGDTIIGGVKKDGQDTLIITRPSDGGFVIIYYDNERDVLDYDASSAELWVEDGNSEPKQLTFGKILKMTGIIKFPMNESKE
jgi:hypothetical protein